MDYICNICGKPASVHITKIIDGKKTKMHLCSECAEKTALSPEFAPPEIISEIKNLQSKIVSEMAPLKSKQNEKRCPKCGTSLSQFQKARHFFCTECYEAFDSELFELLASMHGGLEHHGKAPIGYKQQAKKKEIVENKNQQFLPLELFIDKKEKQKPEPLEKTFVKEEASNARKIEKLNIEMAKAINEERYEDAARIRDKINELEKL